MKSFIALAVAGLVGLSTASPLNDGGKKCPEAKPYVNDPAMELEGLNSYPFHFTSKFFAKATPDQVIATNGSRVDGQPGAVGYYHFGVNAYTELICYNITLVGVTGDYQSPASTATHIHQAAAGKAGPPRISFPNPTGTGKVRTSFGCLQGPFKTGLTGTDIAGNTGVDTGDNFSLYNFEAGAFLQSFTADVHTTAYPAGAVRGQVKQVWWSK